MAAAVEAGITEVDELKSVVAELAEALDGATSRLSGSDDSSAVPNALAELSSAAAHALVQRIEESRSVLETFNIAFFGRTLADTGDVARFADRNRFASWTGTAPIEASSGEVVRHRLSRAGNRRMNHMIHIAAAAQIRLDTDERAYYRRKLAAGKSRREAMRCLKQRISDALYRRLRADAEIAAQGADAGPEGTAGRHFSPARPASTRTPALRSSHFPDPHQRRYPRRQPRGRPKCPRSSNQPLDVRGVPK